MFDHYKKLHLGGREFRKKTFNELAHVLKQRNISAPTVFMEEKEFQEYQRSCHQFFDQLCALAIEKNKEALAELITEKDAPRHNMDFSVLNAENQSVVDYLFARGEKEALKFLAEHFFDHFDIPHLALMGVDFDRIDLVYNVQIVECYTQGDHLEQLQAMLQKDDYKRYAIAGKAAAIYLRENKLARAAAMMDAAYLRQESWETSAYLISEAMLAKKEHWFNEDQDFTTLLASIESNKARAGFIRYLKTKSPLVGTELESHAAFYEQEANKRRAKPAFQKPAAERHPQDTSPDQVEKYLHDIFNEAIRELFTLPRNNNTEKAYQAFRSTLQALKFKTISDYTAGNFDNQNDPLEIARAAKNLVRQLVTDAKDPQAIKTFENRTKPFRKNWSWKVILGAVIGAALGLVAGAMLGAVVGPGAVATALAGAYQGVVIGGGLLGYGGLIAGGFFAGRQQPLVQMTVKAASLQKQLSRR